MGRIETGSPGLGVRTHLCERMQNEWQDPWVAAWAKGQMGAWLLEPVGQCSVAVWDEVDFYRRNDDREWCVTPGGFEGSDSHVDALEQLREAKVLMKNRVTTVLLLEPDGYIRTVKGREPLATLNERSRLWSTSILVDLVVQLPEMETGVTVEGHYGVIDNQLAPARWYTEVSHPYLKNVIERGVKDAVNVLQIFQTVPRPHCSTIAATRELNWEDTKALLWRKAVEVASLEEWHVSSSLDMYTQARLWWLEWIGQVPEKSRRPSLNR